MVYHNFFYICADYNYNSHPLLCDLYCYVYSEEVLRFDLTIYLVSGKVYYTLYMCCILSSDVTIYTCCKYCSKHCVNIYTDINIRLGLPYSLKNNAVSNYHLHCKLIDLLTTVHLAGAGIWYSLGI